MPSLAVLAWASLVSLPMTRPHLKHSVPGLLEKNSSTFFSGGGSELPYICPANVLRNSFIFKTIIVAINVIKILLRGFGKFHLFNNFQWDALHKFQVHNPGLGINSQWPCRCFWFGDKSNFQARLQYCIECVGTLNQILTWRSGSTFKGTVNKYFWGFFCKCFIEQPCLT